jgi:cell division septal protein FtsQ
MNHQADIDKDAIHENVQRTVERAALRKVNKLAEELKNEQLSRKRIERIALIAFVAIFILVGLWVVFADKSFRHVNEIEISGNVTQPRKN